MQTYRIDVRTGEVRPFRRPLPPCEKYREVVEKCRATVLVPGSDGVYRPHEPVNLEV